MFIIWDLVNWGSSPPSYNINGAGYLVLTASKFPIVTFRFLISMKPRQLSCRLLVLPQENLSAQNSSAWVVHRQLSVGFLGGNSCFVWLPEALPLVFVYHAYTEGNKKIWSYVYISCHYWERHHINRSYLSMCHCKTNLSVYVPRFYKTDPNRTSGKIKLTPPVDSYTIVLLVLTLSTAQPTRGWFQQTYFLSGVQNLNGGCWACEGPGLARISGLLVDSLIMLARCYFCWFCYKSASTGYLAGNSMSSYKYYKWSER